MDALCVAMVFWGFSGLLMWWQLKALRGWGAAVLAVSAVTATWMVISMHRFLTP